eukprot:TRINITY_DN9319_c0_g3_i3.p1 TRINITY_DN9319_c0_g3~~TRINITY_DN9319_c0_g3_i3.p1  ORF type:complete len:153 (+),score=10.72 TRINITY_DN9319_c0_g3_i3:86-544(+)
MAYILISTLKELEQLKLRSVFELLIPMSIADYEKTWEWQMHSRMRNKIWVRPSLGLSVESKHCNTEPTPTTAPAINILSYSPPNPKPDDDKAFQMKTIVFTMPQMKTPLNNAVIQAFLKHNPETVVQTWLDKLRDCQTSLFPYGKGNIPCVL